MSSSLHPDEIGNARRRRVLKALLLAMLAVLSVRLYQLQLLYHTELGKKSEDNIVRSIVKEPIRGYIVDRNGVLVAANYTAESGGSIVSEQLTLPEGISYILVRCTNAAGGGMKFKLALESFTNLAFSPVLE